MSGLTTYGKRKIGQQLILPDGVGTNYSRNSGSRTLSAPICAPESNSSSSDTSFRSSRFLKSASELCNGADILPPRLRRPRNLQYCDSDGRENIVVKGNSVFLNNLLPDVTSSDLALFLREIGFTDPVKIVFVNRSSASLEFSHSNVATIAFSLFQYRAMRLFVEPSSADSEHAIRTLGNVIDLTGVDDSHTSFAERSAGSLSPQRSENSPQDLAEDIYDDSTSESTDSEISIRCAAQETKSSGRGSSQNYSERSAIDAHLTKTFELPRDEMSVVGVLARPHRGHHRASSPIGEAQPAISPLPSSTFDSVTDVTRGDGSSVHVVKLPPAPHNRARRVLLPHSRELPMMTVSMKADVQFFNGEAKHRISRYSIPNNSTGHRHTADAVMIGDMAVIVYRSSPCQVSLVHSSEGRAPVLTELKDKPHLEQNTPGTKSGVNCLTARKSTKNAIHFFTGGYDRTIRLWSVTTPDLETKTERLTTLPTIPNALAFKDRILLVGTSKKILTLDLDHLSARPMSAQLSNIIHQIHVHKQAPNVTILEMDSLDFQIQIFDDRKKRGFGRTSDCSFGARCGGLMSARSFSRGDSQFSMFAKGFADGMVRVWDYRNSKRPLLTKTYPDMGAVAHTVFTESGDIVCYNSSNLIFIDSRT